MFNYNNINFKFLSLLAWQDFVEIIILSAIIYQFSLWLKLDKQKNLICPFYIYCSAYFLAHYLNLLIIESVLFSFAPVALLLFLILHQDSLQKNFVLLKRAKTLKFSNHSNQWIENLIKCCIIALNKNKSIIFIIERETVLEQILKAPFKFNADIETALFEILLERHICTDNYLIWFNQEGKLVAINSRFNIRFDNQWLCNKTKKICQWKQEALFVSSKTDSIILKTNPVNRSFDMIIKGKIAESLSSDQVLTVLQNNLDKITKPSFDKTAFLFKDQQAFVEKKQKFDQI